jgi:hypothetical protein
MESGKSHVPAALSLRERAPGTRCMFSGPHNRYKRHEKEYISYPYRQKNPDILAVQPDWAIAAPPSFYKIFKIFSDFSPGTNGLILKSDIIRPNRV